MSRLAASWPFAVDRLPFFYGWVIWSVSTVGILMSIPGQTMGMAVFTDHFIEVLGLSRTQLSIAYLLGTLGSSIFLTRAGRFYDQAGARTTIAAASIVLGLCLVFIGCIDILAQRLVLLAGLPAVALTFPLILLGYFGVRLAGQGVLTSASRNLLLVWFERRRGLVSGARAVFVTLGFSLAPLLLATLIKAFDWRVALFVLAVIVGPVFGLIALVLVRDDPESCGLLADGQRIDATKETPARIPDKTIKQARRSPVFWLYALVLAMYSLFATAMVFHIVSLFAAAGRGAAAAFAYFLPHAMVSVAVNLLASWAADHWPLKSLLIVQLIGFILGACGLLALAHDWGYWLLIVGLGSCSGLWGVLSNLAFIRFFGRLYLGEISGLNMSLTVLGSAIGPALFSVGNDLFGSYDAAIWLNVILLAALLLAAMMIKQEEPGRSP